MKIPLILLMTFATLIGEEALVERLKAFGDSKSVFILDRDDKTNYWNKPRSYDINKYKEIMQILESATEWDGKTGAAAIGMLHAHTPGVTISLSNTDVEEKLKDGQVVFCYGNKLFWVGDKIYMMSAEASAWMDMEFPKNRSGG